VWYAVGSGAPTGIAIGESTATPLEVAACTTSPVAIGDGYYIRLDNIRGHGGWISRLLGISLHVKLNLSDDIIQSSSTDNIFKISIC
jgi:hypothetical protein